MAQDEPTLVRLREAIDALDDELLALLNRRAGLVKEVAARKQAAGAAYYLPSRERSIIDRLQQQNRGPFPDHGIRPVFQEIISACLSLEKGVRIAFLGPEATFTHQAVKRHFGTSAITLPCGSIAAVFEEVEREVADYGVVPVENSSEGVVSHTLDSFLDSPLRIVAEIAVDVEQCLLALPDVDEAKIERVYSHPQALAQCRAWLNANLPRARLIECSSTSDAALRAESDASGAAIAAELASRVYHLRVLRRRLQDLDHNVTRFLALGRGEQEPPQPGGAYKTSLILSAPDRAGFLYEILRPLSEAGINMTKIESRPSRQRPWDYVFFVDLDGHCQEPVVADVLAKMSAACDLFRVLGSYRRADPT